MDPLLSRTSEIHMRIRCFDCGRSEIVSTDTFVKIIGGATAGFGFWAWVSFFFAGTGFALPICIAIAGGGAGMLAYKDDIVNWLVNKGYDCNRCGGQNWGAVSAEVEKELHVKESQISKLEQEAMNLERNFSARAKEAFDYVHQQDTSFSMEDVEDLLDEVESKNSEIEQLLKEKEVWEATVSAQKKVTANLEKRFNTLYSALSFESRALKRISRLTEGERDKLEKQFGFLQNSVQKASFRDDIMGTDVKELGFGNGGRIYIRKLGSSFLIVNVGNKNTQNNDLKHLKEAYKVN